MAATATPDLTLETGVARGIVAYRWLTLAWASLAVIFSRDHLSEPALAAAGLGAAAVFTVLSTVWARDRIAALLHPAVIAFEAGIGTSMLLLDGWIWGGVADEVRRQSLPWAWPHAAILAAAAFLGLRAGLATAAVLAVASFIGEQEVHGGPDSWVGIGSKSALYFLAAIGTALVMRRLRESAREISTARAREEMARTLHDGVLQTLAVIQRRSDDTELVELARRQDHDLRTHLWGPAETSSDFADQIATAARRARDGFGINVSLLIPADLPDLPDSVAGALGGAVGEAITNSAKHARADRVTVFAEPIDDDPHGHTVFCSVHDDGRGFDPGAAEGQGIRRSIRGRIDDVGGRVEIVSSPTRGAEVRFWVGGKEPRD